MGLQGGSDVQEMREGAELGLCCVWRGGNTERIKAGGCCEILDTDRGMEDVSLAAGRSQREKKRSYKDLLREEEEIAEQVRKSSKKRSKDIEITPLATESHKKKKKHSSEDTYYPDVKKKKKHSHPSSSPSSDTAMDLLNSISSPVVSSSKHSSKKAEKILASPVGFQSSIQVTRKEHRKKGREDTPEDLSHKSKKPKPLTLREPEGLKMKLIISPKEKNSEQPLPTQENPVYSDKSSSKKSSKKSRDETEKSNHKKHKKETHTPRHGSTPDTASSSGGDVETGELVIDDSLGEMKKKKKSKKSKKKKDKHKEDKHRKHNKSKREHGLESPKVMATSVLSSSPVTSSSPPPLPSPPATVLLPTPVVLPHPEGATEKKKKKEEVEKPKKKNMSAYQVFSKEYRSSIIAEHPGIDFGELSKKLAEVWKQLPEKDKLVWKQKAQYLQHKQNKAEATTVKRKSSPTESSSKSKGSSSTSGLHSPHKKSSSSTQSFSSSPAKVPDTEPIDVAAHLQLLGESLSLIGHRLQETEVMISKNPGMVAVSGSLSVLLDSVLCALGPLVCLTSHIPQLNACPKQVLSNTLDNIAYVMPGL
ncbi:HMG domain-containing protein 4 isoform X2 [Aquarana catesbeiana]|uniref:HMG domain-containing protein 4 isoform X2 n=1 Tax=Aquarana catesbeiana TaxID=8400 RepID=UPI003CC9486F